MGLCVVRQWGAGAWHATKHLIKMNVSNAVWMFLHKTIIATIDKILNMLMSISSFVNFLK